MWQFMGIVCLAVALMAAYFHAFEVILPLCAILLSLGSIFTGVLIRYTRFSGLSSMGVLLGLRMLFEVWDKSSFFADIAGVCSGGHTRNDNTGTYFEL